MKVPGPAVVHSHQLLCPLPSPRVRTTETVCRAGPQQDVTLEGGWKGTRGGGRHKKPWESTVRVRRRRSLGRNL